MRRKTLIGIAMAITFALTPIVSFASVVQSVSNPNPMPPANKIVNTYTVKPGDNLWTLARMFGIKLDTLESENHITKPHLLQVGTKLTYITWSQPGSKSLGAVGGSVNSSSTSTSSANSSANSSGNQNTAKTHSVAASKSTQSTSRTISLSQGTVPYTKLLYCTLTAYTAGPLSTGKHPGDKGYGITSTGKKAKQGVTVAVDPHIIPYGTKLYIPGLGFRIAQDTGGAINGDHIDVFYNQRSTALKFGVKHHEKVYILPSSYQIPSSG